MASNSKHKQKKTRKQIEEQNW